MKLKGTLEAPASVIVRFNGEEVHRRDFAAGEQVQVEYDPPVDVSGEVHLYLLQNDAERTLPGYARYTCGDVKGAQMRMEDAAVLATKGDTGTARTKLEEAIEILERLASESEDLSSAKARLILLDAVSSNAT